MDLQPDHHQEATSSSSSFLHPPIQDQQQQPLSSLSSVESGAPRSSARVKAAKKKENNKGKERETTSYSATPLETLVSRNTRSTSNLTKTKPPRDNSIGKGKAPEFSDQSQSRTSKRCVHSTYL